MQGHGKGALTPEEAFSKVLREVRLKKGLSQEALGFESGYHRTYIGMLERGLMNPSLRTVFSLAAALKIPAKDLVARVEDFLGVGWRRPERKPVPKPRKGM
jgi:transcriptional regulator with XRE-family HTH domain